MEIIKKFLESKFLLSIVSIFLSFFLVWQELCLDKRAFVLNIFGYVLMITTIFAFAGEGVRTYISRDDDHVPEWSWIAIATWYWGASLGTTLAFVMYYSFF